MPTISKRRPCLIIPTLARNRLPVFRTDALDDVACRALDKASTSIGFGLFACAGRPSLPLNGKEVRRPPERRSLSTSQAAEPQLMHWELAEKGSDSKRYSSWVRWQLAPNRTKCHFRPPATNASVRGERPKHGNPPQRTVTPLGHATSAPAILLVA